MPRLKVCRVQKWALVAVLLPAAARRCYLFAPPPPSLPKRSTNYFYFISFMLPLLLPRLRLRLLLLRVKWPQDKHLQMFSQQRECVYGPCVPVCVCVRLLVSIFAMRCMQLAFSFVAFENFPVCSLGQQFSQWKIMCKFKTSAVPLQRREPGQQNVAMLPHNVAAKQNLKRTYFRFN